MQLLLYPVILDLFCARQVLPAFGYRKDVEVVKSRLVVYKTNSGATTRQKDKKYLVYVFRNGSDK